MIGFLAVASLRHTLPPFLGVRARVIPCGDAGADRQYVYVSVPTMADYDAAIRAMAVSTGFTLADGTNAPYTLA